MALESTAALLADLGHHVEEIKPPLDWEAFIAALTATFCAGTAADVVPLAGMLGLELSREHFEATTLAAARAGAALTPMDLARASATNNAASRTMAAFMSEWDVLVTPTAITPPVPLRTFDAADDSFGAEAWVRHVIAPHPTCALYNVTGAPAISLPIGSTGGGLPIGVQFGADAHREDVLLALAAQLEQARAWADRTPASRVNLAASTTRRRV